jgi:hypothetical protein
MTGFECPEDTVVHPRVPSNSPGLTQLDYRVGTFTTFRHALTRARPNEGALSEWDPTDGDDLALQLLEWWAYLADILTFYNERALSRALLRTATLSEDLRRVVGLLGYRPRPGIGATGVVAALTDSPRPFVVPRGWPIQGTAAGARQVFEVDDDVEIGLVGRPLPASARFSTDRGNVPDAPTYADRAPDGRLLNWIATRDADQPPLAISAGVETTLVIKGSITNVAPGDVVVVMPADWDGTTGTALALVSSLEHAWDEHGRPVSNVKVKPGQDFPAGVVPADSKVMKPTKSAHLWLYHERYPGPKLPSLGGSILQVVEGIFDPGGLVSGGVSKEPPQDAHVLTSRVQLPASLEGAAHLEGITRGLNPGDPVLFEQTVDGAIASMIAQIFAALPAQLRPAVDTLTNKTLVTKVSGYTELIWYANPPEADRIGQGPPIGPPSHGLISGGAAPIPIPHSRISFVDTAGIAEQMSAQDTQIKTVVVHYAWEPIGDVVKQAETRPVSRPDVPAAAGVPPGTPTIIEDATGAGHPGFVGRDTTETFPLVPPLRALLNLLPVSRGEQVAGEIIGSGDSGVARQEFRLARSPVTYLTDTGPHAFDGYRSTLRIHVNGIEWHEVPSFYGQPPDARVFATREDDAQRTYVRFGDGQHGARLPSGTANVVADYRVGSGAAVPPIGALTTILRPQPGLSSIRNPIPPAGGSDPDPPEQIRRYAPQSVLAFGRAVSGDDYEVIAAQTPGVDRARAVWKWDADAQRTLVTVLVGDDDDAVAAARRALRAFAPPNRPVAVSLAAPVFVDLALTIEVDPDHLADQVEADVTASLLNPYNRPFGASVVRIGDAVYDSQIYRACADVPGVIAVHGLRFSVAPTSTAVPLRRLPPGYSPRYERAVLGAQLRLRDPEPTERHFPGPDRFYLLRAEQFHITTVLPRHGS